MNLAAIFDDFAELFINGVLVDSINQFTANLPAADVISESVTVGDSIEVRLTNGASLGGFTVSFSFAPSAAIVVANDDTPPAVNGLTGATTASVLDNDTLNGAAVDPADITLAGTGTASDGTTALGLDATPAAGSITLNADGTLTVAPGTTAGTYVYTYEICEDINPTNCSIAQATVEVSPPAIAAVDDTPPAVNGLTGATTASVLDNDTLNGAAVDPADITLAGTGTASDGTTALGLDATPAAGSITLNADGTLTVAPGTTAGTYVYTYEICEDINPTNCSIAQATITTTTPSLIAQIEADLVAVLEEDRATTIELQSRQARDFASGALDRLRERSGRQCEAAVNGHLEDRPILFDTDKAIIKPESDPILDEIAEILGTCEGSTFEIAGHTDSDASDDYNLALSQRRVDAVLRALEARDVATDGYRTRGYGESRPIDSNATTQGKARNRRVEFVLLAEQDHHTA